MIKTGLRSVQQPATRFRTLPLLALHDGLATLLGRRHRWRSAPIDDQGFDLRPRLRWDLLRPVLHFVKPTPAA